MAPFLYPQSLLRVPKHDLPILALLWFTVDGWPSLNSAKHIYIYDRHDSHDNFFSIIFFAKSIPWKNHMTKNAPHLSGFSWIGCYRLSWMWRASRANSCGERQTSWRRVDRWGFFAWEKLRKNPWWLMSWGTYEVANIIKKGKTICMHKLLETGNICLQSQLFPHVCWFLPLCWDVINNKAGKWVFVADAWAGSFRHLVMSFPMFLSFFPT